MTNREYTEVKVFSGFRGHFRLEEREPEVALIDLAELVVVLTNGKILSLKPDNRKLAERDGDYLRHFWGDSAQIEFALPKSVTEEDVIESRLGVTGYYLRYANLIARQKSPEALTVGDRSVRGLSSATSSPGATLRIVGTMPK